MIIMLDIQRNNPDCLISGFSVIVNSIKASSLISMTLWDPNNSTQTPRYTVGHSLTQNLILPILHSSLHAKHMISSCQTCSRPCWAVGSKQPKGSSWKNCCRLRAAMAVLQLLRERVQQFDSTKITKATDTYTKSLWTDLQTFRYNCKPQRVA